MIYKDICLNNQYLYGHLEQLSYEIAYCILHEHTDKVEALQRQKDAVKELININLDKIEKIWQAFEKKRPAIRIQQHTKATSKQQLIIKSFLFNEDNCSTTIAKKLHVDVNTVNRTIDSYLSHKIIHVA